MRVLVTGGAGFIGGETARRLAAAGHEVHATCRPGTAATRLAPLPRPVVVHHCDLTDLPATVDVIGRSAPEAVVHAAASRGHAVGAAASIAAWHDDVIATVTLLHALRHTPVRRLVHVCSSLVYRPSAEALDESAPLQPETERGAAKLAAATAVLQWSEEEGVPTVVIRPFSVYGPGGPEQRVIPTLLRSLWRDEPFPVVAAENRRDFIAVADVVESVTMALEVPAVTTVFNIGTGVETSIAALIELAERVTGRSARLAERPHPGTPPRRPHWRADWSHAAATLGWAPRVDLESGLAAMWDRL